MEILGYLCSALVGLALGLIGGGGSILTVPVLVYLFAVPASSATAYSLFIVGLTALVGAVGYARSGEVDWRMAAIFGPPSILAVYTVRLWGMPRIPAQIGAFTRDQAILGLFALLMIGTAISMIRPTKEGPVKESQDLPYIKIALEGLGVGAVTGLVGAGGGFLIIPALVLWAGLPIRRAVATSLVLIAAKSLIGFIGDVQTQANIDWRLLFAVAGMAMVGLLVGLGLAKKISGARLKPAFGIFVLVMGTSMIVKETFFSKPVADVNRSATTKSQGK